MASNREEITVRAMFMKDLNEALNHTIATFWVADITYIWNSWWDIAMELCLKFWFTFNDFKVVLIIWWWFVNAAAIKNWVEVKRFNYQYEKYRLIDAINKTVPLLYNYCVEQNEITITKSTNRSWVKSVDKTKSKWNVLTDSEATNNN